MSVMSTDRRIEQAIEAGERNKRTLELVRNWCSHARIKNVGGVGLVHQMRPDLPIGHLAIECDHAAAGGIAAWDLAEAALDFHDRNCFDCPHRAPVGLPNLSSLLNEREAARAKAKAEDDARERRLAEAFEARQSARRSLRDQLNPVRATIVDALEELDRERSDAASERLLATARLAREHFVPPLIEHFFRLLEAGESWFERTGMSLLHEIKADPPRLARCAILSLSHYGPIDTAAAIVEANVGLVDPALVAGALPALVDLAVPPHQLFLGEPWSPLPGPLIAVHRAHPAATEAAISRLLEQVRNRQTTTAANAVGVLARMDPPIATRFARPLAAKLARAERLLEPDTDRYGEDAFDTAIAAVRQALVLAFHHDPDAVDALLMSFLEGATDEGQGRIFSVYHEVLQGGPRKGERAPVPALKAALKRVIWAATSAKSKEILDEVQSALRFGPDELAPIAGEELDALLGAAVLMDDRLRRFDASPPPAGSDLLAMIEHNTRRGTFASLRDHMISWAASGAAGNGEATSRLMALFAGIPEESEQLRAAMVGHMDELVRGPDDLNIILPHLYSALVGSSNLMRAAAAGVVGRLDHRRVEDAPELLLEAFLALLLDPFVIVHREAVSALRRIDLPERLERQARNALLMLIGAYAIGNDRSSDDFLVDCIRLYAGSYATEEQIRGRLGRWLLAMLGKAGAGAVARGLYSLFRTLGTVEGFGALLLRLVQDEDAMNSQGSRILQALGELPAETVFAEKAEIERVAVALAGKPELSAVFVEVLTRAGAWAEAVRVADAAHAGLRGTTRERPRKLAADLVRLAARYEQAIADGDQAASEDLARQWRETLSHIEEDTKKNAQRRDPLGGIFRSH